uniref:Uncharacterized protein n=1 Tax=Ciona savignyi TaxID=51511 RepID=H2YPS1_CIOSA
MFMIGFRSPDRRYHDNRSRGYYGNNQRYNQRYRGHNQYRGNYQNYNNRGNYYHNNRGYNRGYNNNYRGRGYYNNNNYNRDQRPQWKPRRHEDDDRGTRSQERSRSRSSSRGESPKRASYAKEMRDHRVVQSSAPESPRPADARDQIESAKKFTKLRRKSPDQWAHDMFQESDKDDK